MRRICNFGQYVELVVEGGKMFDNTRPIAKREIKATLESIEETLFKEIGLTGLDQDAVLIGSAKEADGIGDIDIGVLVPAYAEKHGIKEDEVIKYIYDEMRRNFPEYEVRWMRGLEVASIAWPIGGDPNKGYAQVDILPVYDEAWSQFVYARPTGSKYKSAVRNCLLFAALSEMADKNGDGYMMRLGKGLYSVGSKSTLVTRNPVKLVSMIFPGNKPKDVTTFERTWRLLTDPSHPLYEKMDAVILKFKEFLQRAKLQVPDEVDKFKKEDDGSTEE